MSEDEGTKIEGVVETRRITSVKSLGDFMQRMDELDHETYDESTNIKCIQARIANNRTRLAVFQMAFKAGILNSSKDKLTLPGETAAKDAPNGKTAK